VLRPSDDLQDDATRVLAEERRLLAEHGVPGTVHLVGGASVRGALTHGDVDLHLRVAPAGFERAIDLLRPLHPVIHPEIWCPTLATFEVVAHVPAGLAVTPLGSEHDVRFTRPWALLSGDRRLLDAYNAMKLADGGMQSPEAERRKSEFFDRLLAEDASSISVSDDLGP
jgi:hypothetical protein